MGSPIVEPRDLAGALSLIAASGLPTSDLGDARPSDFRVIEHEGVVVAVVGMETHGTSGLLRSLAVVEEARGQGLATRLVQAVEALATARGLETLYLLTETAAPFFAARGFETVARADVPDTIRGSTQFAACCPASAACMGKRVALPARGATDRPASG